MAAYVTLASAPSHHFPAGEQLVALGTIEHPIDRLRRQLSLIRRQVADYEDVITTATLALSPN